MRLPQKHYESVPDPHLRPLSGRPLLPIHINLPLQKNHDFIPHSQRVPFSKMTDPATEHIGFDSPHAIIRMTRRTTTKKKCDGSNAKKQKISMTVILGQAHPRLRWEVRIVLQENQIWNIYISRASRILTNPAESMYYTAIDLFEMKHNPGQHVPPPRRRVVDQMRRGQQKLAMATPPAAHQRPRSHSPTDLIWSHETSKPGLISPITLYEENDKDLCGAFNLKKHNNR